MTAQPPAPRRPPVLPDGRMSLDGSSSWALPNLAPRSHRVPYVRQQARLVLALWRLADLTAPVEVLVSELATNVVRHACTYFAVAMAWDGRTLRVEVTDASPLAPQPQPATFDSEGGRGLLLIDAVAHDWGVNLEPHGKTVWFTIDRDAADPW